MQKVELSLSGLSIEQKLDLIERIWADICSSETEFKSPEWHQQILSERAEMIAAGKANFSDWEEAKQRIRENVSKYIRKNTKH